LSQQCASPILPTEKSDKGNLKSLLESIQWNTYHLHTKIANFTSRSSIIAYPKHNHLAFQSMTSHQVKHKILQIQILKL
jgi:hypothetical protein